MPNPRLTVTAPAQTPLGFGLLPCTSENLRVDPHARFGVEYEPTSGLSGGVQLIDASNRPVGERVPEFHEDGDLPLVTTDPFLIYAGVKAKPVGVTVAELQDRAKAKLQLLAGRFIEAGFHPQLVADATVHPETAAAVDPDIAIGLLEEWLADVVGGQGVIHVPRRGFGALGKVTKDAGTKKVTQLGCPVAFGTGYVNIAPDGSAAAPGTVWVYATGPVQVNRTGTELWPEDVGAAMTLRYNDAEVYATEVVSVGYEAGAIAVPVKFEVENP